MTLAWMFRVVAIVLAIVAGTTAAGGGVTYAATYSLPGDTLYPAKLVTEDVRLALTIDPAARAELSLAFSTARVREMQQLIERGDPEPVREDVLARMAQHTERAMMYIAESAPEDVPGLLEEVMTQTRAHEQALHQVQTKVPEGTQAAFQHALEATQRAYETASAAQEDPSRYQQEYRHRYGGAAGPRATEEPPEKGAPPSGTPGQLRNREQVKTVTPTCTPQQDRDREQRQLQTPQATRTPQQDREQEQQRLQTPQATRTPSGPAQPDRGQGQGDEQRREQSGEQTQEQNQDGGQQQEQNREQNQEGNQGDGQHQEQNQAQSGEQGQGDGQNQEQNQSGDQDQEQDGEQRQDQDQERDQTHESQPSGAAQPSGSQNTSDSGDSGQGGH